MNDVDEISELEVQVGRDKSSLVIPVSTLTNKYKSVIMKGFTKDTSLDSILEILVQQG